MASKKQVLRLAQDDKVFESIWAENGRMRDVNGGEHVRFATKELQALPVQKQVLGFAQDDNVLKLFGQQNVIDQAGSPHVRRHCDERSRLRVFERLQGIGIDDRQVV
jgi:hypothetical protein